MSQEIYDVPRSLLNNNIANSSPQLDEAEDVVYDVPISSRMQNYNTARFG